MTKPTLNYLKNLIYLNISNFYTFSVIVYAKFSVKPFKLRRLSSWFCMYTALKTAIIDTIAGWTS